MESSTQTNVNIIKQVPRLPTRINLLMLIWVVIKIKAPYLGP